MKTDHRPERFDVVIVGARVAGSATALLLARAGLRVLILDRGDPGTDTLSTHALTRGAVIQLQRWGVLGQLLAAGTPPIRRTTFHYGDETFAVEMTPRDGVDSLIAPRRTVLDPVLNAAAHDAGVDIRHGSRARELIRDESGRVLGLTFVDGSGREHTVRAAVTVGADGARSLVAREAGAAITWEGTHRGAMLYGHFQDPGVDGYHWCYCHDATAGVIPTNDDMVCVWAGTSTERFMAELRGDPAGSFRQLLKESAPDFADAFSPDQAESRIFGHPGMVGHLRRPWGPGWALVGDAGYFKDPLTAHGITDALRDAELLSEAIINAASKGSAAFAHYEACRDDLSMDFANVTDSIASYEWDMNEIKALVREEGRLLADEARLFASADTWMADAD